MTPGTSSPSPKPTVALPARTPHVDGVRIGSAAHVAEREADAVARAAPGTASLVPDLRASRRGVGEGESRRATPVETSLTRSALVGGKPLDGPTRARFEARLGLDLGVVRVHDDAAAHAAAGALAATAFTLGSHVVFAEGRYAPASDRGSRLLAHELAHVVQQSGGSAPVIQRQEDPTVAAILADTRRYQPPSVAEVREEDLLAQNRIAPQVASAKDQDVAALGPEFKRRVDAAARQVGLDPGFLAACMLAETRGTLNQYRGAYLSPRSEMVSAAAMGLDDIKEERALLRAKVPAFRRIQGDLSESSVVFTPEVDAKEGRARTKPDMDVRGDSAVVLFASYLKLKELQARQTLADAGIDFDSLPMATRLFMTRSRMNPPHRRGIHGYVKEIGKGANPLSKGIESAERKAGDARRGATMTTVQAVHLARVLFGGDLLSDPVPDLLPW